MRTCNIAHVTFVTANNTMRRLTMQWCDCHDFSRGGTTSLLR